MMKRIFTLSLLMIAFVMNAVAWEPVIKETHWFGMYEYYNYSDPTFKVSDYLDNVDFSNLNGWSQTSNGTTITLGNGKIGECYLENGSGDDYRKFISTTDNNHLSSEYCLCFSSRWSGNYASYTQRTKQKLPSGSYKLVFDVQNLNGGTTSASYNNLFFVQIGDDQNNRRIDQKTEWMNGQSGWTTHTIEFYIAYDQSDPDHGAQNVTISLGYGTGENNYGHTETPALFISNLELKKMNGTEIRERNIIRNQSDNQIIEAIEVVKGWTGQGHWENGTWIDDLQRPKTSFYSWIDRQFRFSTNRTDGTWVIDKNNNRDYEGFGLKNTTDAGANGTAFKILNLNAGDTFSVEYYLDSYDSAMPYLANGNNEMTGTVDDMTPDNGDASIIESKVDYTMATAGNVQIFMPANAVIRCVTITYPNERYQKAEVEVDELTAQEVESYGKPNHVGYRYSFSSPGVLEDKRGAVPYITMKFGHNNDMTFVRNVGDPGNGVTYYAASSIIDESNNFDPDDAKLQAPYHDYTAAQMKDRLAGKEWSVFTASQTQPEGTGDFMHQNGDYFNTIYPLYGSYYYFFPEVNGRLVVEFYCEGSEESCPLWYKKTADGFYPLSNGEGEPIQPWTKEGEITRVNTNADGRTTGANFYRYTLDVEKGGIYYLCSLPTNIAHEHPIVRLISYSFIPDFRMEPIYKVVDNVTAKNYSHNDIKYAAEIFGGPYYGLDTDDLNTVTDGKYTRNKELEDRVKCLGNVASATVKVFTENGHQYLGFSNITFKDEIGDGLNENGEKYNRGGAIVAHINNEYGQGSFVLTIAYDAAQAEWGKDANGNNIRLGAAVGNPATRTEVKRWDFYTGNGEQDVLGIGHGWELGKYGEGNYPLYDPNKTDEQNKGYFDSPKIWKETHKADGLTADWTKTYVNLLNGGEEPIFKSVYDMEADNADMIHETAGLVFFTEANQLGIWNENDAPTSSFQDRFIGLMGGGKLIIPRLEADDRVVIKMGCFGNAESASRGTADFEQEAVLWLTNAKDAKGTVIPAETNYVIGGSTPFEGETVPRGEYHFMVNETSNSDATDFAIELKEGGLLKIYSIDIYRNAANDNADILTENEFAGDKPEILYTDKDNGVIQKFKVKLNYSGFGETQTMSNLNTPSQYDKYRTGKFKAQGATVPTFSATNDGQFESTTAIAHDMFGTFRNRIGVLEKNKTYVTDYADGDLAVGYRETKTYPYTWDFTDLKKYVGVGLDNSGNEKNVSTIEVDGQPVTLDELKVWDQFGLRVNSETATGTLFVSGGQLYGDQTMFEETKGIGIGYTKSNAAHNKILTITGNANDESGALQVVDDAWTFTVPEVAAGQAVYVHATPGTGAVTPQYAIGDGEKQDLPLIGNNAFAMKMADGAETADVKLYFQGCNVNKIAVATDEKTVNDEGWNTESRDHAIDPSLLPYMTGRDFRTYAVFNGPTTINGTNVITLTRIDGGSGADGDATDATGDNNKKIIDAAEDDGPNACIIRYVGEAGTEDIFGDGKGFHLFKPDIHDVSSDMTGNLLKAQLTKTAETGAVPRQDGSNYNYGFTNKYKYVDDKGDQLKGREGVYTGKQAFYLIMNGGAASDGNQAYLSLNSKVSSAAARLLLYIEGESDGNGEATGIVTVDSTAADDGNVRFYNLNGQQLSGKPNRSGLYIMNGKKVSVKNK